MFPPSDWEPPGSKSSVFFFCSIVLGSSPGRGAESSLVSGGLPEDTEYISPLDRDCVCPQALNFLLCLPLGIQDRDVNMADPGELPGGEDVSGRGPVEEAAES